MPDYTKIFGQSLRLIRSLSPGGVGKDATFFLLKHAGTQGYTRVTTSDLTNENWHCKQDEEIGGVALKIAESAVLTREVLQKTNAVAINGNVYKPIEPGGKRPPLSRAKRIWLFKVSATGETYEP